MIADRERKVLASRAIVFLATGEMRSNDQALITVRLGQPRAIEADRSQRNGMNRSSLPPQRSNESCKAANGRFGGVAVSQAKGLLR